jgi:glutamate racemase
MSPFKIGIFDSGMGGLMVMKAIVQQLPGVSIAYFGDTARLPYGDKSPAVINRYTQAGIKFLTTQHVQLCVVACNTASAHSLSTLHTAFSLPIVDVIAPSAAAACRLSRHGRIAILGTTATIRSQCYQKHIASLRPEAEVTAIACPLFVPLVEEQMMEHPATTLIVQEYLKPLRSAHVDTVILGCTHYPLLRAAIAAEVGENVCIVDSATTCADHTFRCITASAVSTPTPTYQFFVSDNAERFRHLALSFLPILSSDLKVSLVTHDY